MFTNILTITVSLFTFTLAEELQIDNVSEVTREFCADCASCLCVSDEIFHSSGATELFVANSVEAFKSKNVLGSDRLQSISSSTSFKVTHANTGPESGYYVGNKVLCDLEGGSTCKYKVLLFTFSILPESQSLTINLTGYDAPTPSSTNPPSGPPSISPDNKNSTDSPTGISGDDGWVVIVVPIVGVCVGLILGVVFWTWLLRKRNEQSVKTVKFTALDISSPISAATGSSIDYYKDEEKSTKVNHKSYAWNDDRDSTVIESRNDPVELNTDEIIV